MSEWSDTSASSGPVAPGAPPIGDPGGSDIGGPPALHDYTVADPGGSSSPKGGRRPRRVVAAVVGVLALLATGLAISQLAAADGAESPEAAVQALFDAIGDEDALGVLESLSPSERDLLVPSVEKLAIQFARVEVAGPGADLDKVSGVDVVVDDLDLRTKGLHPDVAAVEVTGGDIDVSATLGDLPLGRALTGVLETEGGLDLDEKRSASGPIDVTLVTVKVDDRWHVSLLYSLAEADRADSGDPLPDFGNGIPAKGADSPRAAVEAMVTAFNDGDLGRMIELTPPDSMAVLHDYGPAWVADQADDGDGDGDDDGDGDGDDDGYEERLEDVELGEPEGSGDSRRLSVEGFRHESTYGGESSAVQIYDGECMTSSYSYTTGSGMDGYVDPEEPEETEETEAPVKTCVGDEVDAWATVGYDGVATPAGPLLFGPGQADIVVVERDGLWYVDPARTVIDTLLLNLGAMSPEQTKDMLRGWAVWLNEDEDAYLAMAGAQYYRDTCPGVEAPADDAPFEERMEAGRRCAEEMDAFYDDEVDTGTTEAEDACYDTYTDDDAIDACVNGVYNEEESGGEGGVGPLSDCYETSADDLALERCVASLGDPEALEEVRENQCYELADDPAVDACLQGRVDAGELSPEVLAEFRCDAVYEALPDDASDEEWEQVDEEYDRCMADAGFPAESFGDDAGSSGGPPGGVEVAPTTTVVGPGVTPTR